MAKYSSSVNYKITTSLDASGVTRLQAELNKVETQIKTMQSRGMGLNNKQALADIQQIQRALKTAFNPSLGMMNTKKLMTELTSNGRSLSDVFNSLGSRSTTGMTQLAGQIGKIDTGMKSVNKTADKLMNTLGNTVRWGIIASGFQYMMNGAHSAVNYMKDLDESLTNIRMVTDESKESMREFAKYANDAAKNLGNTTVAYTDAALIYAQQGYGLSDQKKLADYTLMTANATGQGTAEVSEQMTSMINGFKLSVDEVGSALDVMAKVANTSAADLEELATATAKVASTANTLGVTQEQLTAQIATVVSVTREAPENVGNALKTIYARFGDLQLGETLEDGTDLGKVSSTLEKIGVQVLDSSGKMRDMGLIIEDLMAIWDTLDTATKQGAAVTLAGKYQYNRLMALMENSDMYEGYYDDAINSAGTLEEMQAEYMDSLEGKANALKASFEGLLTNLFDQDDFGEVLEGLTQVIDKFSTLVEAIGGGGQALTAFGAIATRVFSGSVGRSIGSIIENRQMQMLANQNVMQARQVAMNQLAGQGINTGDKRVVQFANDTARINQYSPSMNNEQVQRSNELLKQRETSLTTLLQKEEKYNQELLVLKAAYSSAGVSQEAFQKGAVEFLRDLEAADVKMTDFSGDVSALRDRLANLRIGFANLTQAMKTATTDNTTEAWEKVSAAAKKLKGESRTLITTFKSIGLSGKQAGQAMKVLRGVMDGSVSSVEQLKTGLSKLDLTLDQLVEAFGRSSQALNKSSKDFDKSKAELENLRISYESTRAAVQRFEAQLKTQTIATHLTNMASGLMSAVFAFQSLKNIGSILSNDDLTAAEKMEQVIMNSAMVLAMGIPVITGAVEGYKVLTTQLKGYLVAQAMENTLATEGFVAKSLSTEATHAAILADLEKANSTKGVTTQELGRIAATYGVSEAEVMGIATTKGYTVATAGLSSALKGLWAAMAPYAGVAAAIALIAGGVYAAYKVYNRDAEAAEKAAEKADQLKQVYSDLNTELGNLKDNISNYQEARDAMGGLAKDTDEWRASLEKVNEEVLNLLENYPELAKYVYRDENGVLGITQEGLDAAVEAQETAVAQAQNASLLAQAAADQASVQAQKTTTERGVDFLDSTGTYTNLATYKPGAIDVLHEAYQENPEIFNDETLSSLLGVDVTDPVVKAVQESSADLIRYFEAADAKELSFQIQQEQVMQNLLNEQVGYNSKNIANNDDLLSWLTNMGGLDSAEYQNQLIQAKQKSTKELAYEYAELNGLDTTGIKIDDKIFGESTATIDGKEITREAMEEAVAGANAMELAAEKWDDVADKLLGISETSFDKAVNGKGYGALSSFATAGEVDISEWNRGEQERAQTLLNEKGSLSIEDIFGAGKDASYYEEAVQNLGFTGTPEEFATQYSEALATSLTTAIDNTVRSYLKDNPNLEASKDNDKTIIEKAKNSEDIEFAQRKGKLTEDGYVEGFIKLGKAIGGVEDEVDAAEKALSDYNKAVEKSGKNSKQAKKAAEQLATAEVELRDAVKSQEWANAKKDLREYKKTLKDAEKGSEEYVAATQAISDSLRELTGVKVDQKWVEDNEQAVQDWLNGVEGAGAKLSALINIDYPVQQVKNQLTQMGIDWQTMRDQIANDDIHFDMSGTADFAQVEAALAQLSGHAFDATEDLDLLAAYLNALGGASLKLEKEGEDAIDIPAPDLTGNADQISENLEDWMNTVRDALKAGWHFASIDLPESQTTLPTTSNTGGPGGGGGSGGGSGGGGGGGKKYEPKKKEKIEDKPDRYQNVNSHMDRLSKSLEKIANEEDRLAGKDMLDNLEQQAEIIEKQARWQQRKLEIQQQEAAELRNQLSSDFGIKFDSEGFMTNYQAMHNKLVNKVNNLIAQYNAATTEAAQEALESKIEEAQKELDEFNEAWERYNELMNNEIPESQNALEEYADQIEDLRIKAFQATVEATDNIKAVKDAWADYMGFMSGYDPDSPFRALTEDAERYENALESVGRKQEDLEYLLPFLSDYEEGGTISKDNPFGENSAEYYEALKEAYESYIEGVLEAEQLYYDQIEDVIEGYDDIVDRISDRMEKYARLTEQLDHYASMVEMVYGEEDYDKLLALKRANQDVLESSIKQSSATLTMLEQELAKMEAAGAPQKIIDDLKNKVVEAEQELEGLMEEAAQNIAEILEMAVDKTVKEWKDSMLGGDADWMETQWELAKRNADQYLDTVEETYEIEKLRSKYNSLANDTTDLNIRKRINDQMQKELAYLQEKDKLSEYDVNYANAKLEILQKQIALEEAQANKNQMKLRRDSQGNYNYVYAGDQDNIEDARNDLLDAEFNAYSMSKDNYITNYDNYISAVSQAAEQIKAINADVSLSEEEKAKRTQAVYDNLAEYLKGVAEQIGVSEQNMIEAVKYLAMDSGEIVGQTYVDIAAMMEESWTEALGTIGVAVSEEFDHIIHNIDDFLDDTKEKWDEFTEHTEEWAKDIQDIAEDGTDAFLDIDDVIIDINDDMKDLNESTAEFFSLINDDLGTIDAAVGRLADYERQIQGLKNTTSKIRAELEKTKRELAKKEEELRIARGESSGGSGSPGDGGPGGGGGSGDGGPGNGGPLASEANKIGIAQAIWTYGGSTRGWGNDPIRSKKLTKNFGDAFAKSVQDYINENEHNGKLVNYNSKKFFSTALVGYDTGGYTGTWEDGNDQAKNGKLAWLHQKELVLNATDTENILNAVSLIRDVVNAIKLDSISSTFASLGGGKNIATNTGNNVQQNIEIYADFPAAESAAEIKAALEGLAQQAVQYSFRDR